jgi:hypothetical protein
MLLLTDRVKSDLVLFGEALDTGAAAVPTAFVSLAEYRGCCFAVAAGPVAAQSGLEVTILQSSDDAGRDAKPVGDPLPVTASGESILFVAEVLAEQLDVNNGFAYVGLLLDGPDTITATVVALRFDARYMPPSEPVI